MEQVFWYLAGTERHGPFEQSEIASLIEAGPITRETLIWDSGVNEWRPAGTIAVFGPLFDGPAASGAPAAPPAGPELGRSVPGHLRADFPVWGLLWRGAVRTSGSLFVIPAPWAAAFYYRFLCSRIALPNGVALHFAGRARDIWHIHVAIAILGLAGRSQKISFVALVLIIWLQIYVLRWFCAKLRAADGSLEIQFTGGTLPYLGWYVLVVLSAFTVIGWAWALKYFYRWLCRNIEGTHHFDFTAPGWAILWRVSVFAVQIVLVVVSAFYGVSLSGQVHNMAPAAVLFAAAAALVIAIPWTIRWIFKWWVSQISVVA